MRSRRLLVYLTTFVCLALPSGVAAAAPQVAARTQPGVAASDPTPDEINSTVNLALDYPYEDVPGSYLFVNGKAYPYQEVGRDPIMDSSITFEGEEVAVKDFLNKRLSEIGGQLPPDTSQRTPVIGYGSNRAPSALARKFVSPGFTRGWSVIPVIKADLKHFEVTHAANFFPNGNQPATIRYAEEASSEVFVTWMDKDELARMHSTEGLDDKSPRSWYQYGKLDNIELRPKGGNSLTSAYVYVDNYGSTKVGGKTYSLKKVGGTPVSERVSQEGILNKSKSLKKVGSVPVPESTRWTCGAYFPDSVRNFVCATYVDPCVRADRTEQLMKYSEPFSLPRSSGMTYTKKMGSSTAGNPIVFKGPRCPHNPDIG
ncbi:hypothetical protein I5Q34_29275 [Streptomyces sp. AV19]|uniref:hypothetical protein n=1 Tax=Streptomyces sp. AV19 TaxID=2793068 RepID=UPI0018FE5AE3|nr:hypothetical protein [Streptomyces sp. AV19]MBH1938300.1 hypothetical protein [Streptomyces sp. AV19]MDG4534941.1 hypothetical protein [Streptomyces sp. AV19]